MARRAYFPTAMIATAVLVACSLVTLLALSEREADAAFPGKNGRVAFQGFRDVSGTTTSASEVITVRPDGTDEKQLTSNSGSGDPTFSPDGEKIAYSGSASISEGDNEIYVMDRTGGGKRPLTANDIPEYGPAWSPDGTKIAFMRQQRIEDPDGNFLDWQPDVWIMNADGSAKRQLTDDLDFESGPTFSPDGKQIAFDEGGEIWTINPDGSGLRNLTQTPNVWEIDPDFSPDGTRIAFASDRDYRKYDVYTMNLDGSDLTNVTDTRYVGDEDCVWSPDGTKIAYTRVVSGDVEIVKKNADGSGRATNVSNDPEYNESPDWGPKPAAG